MLGLSKICPADTNVFWRTLQVFRNTYFVEQLQIAASEKTFLHMFFQLKFPLFTNNFTQVMFSQKLMHLPFHIFYQ